MAEPLSVLSAAFAIPSLIDSCLRGGDALAKLITDIKTADNQIESSLKRISLFYKEHSDYLKWCEAIAKADPGRAEGLETQLSEVLADIESLCTTLKGTIPTSSRTRLRFGLIEKRSINRKVKDLDSRLNAFHRFVNTTMLFLDISLFKNIVQESVTDTQGGKAVKRLQTLQAAIKQRQPSELGSRESQQLTAQSLRLLPGSSGNLFSLEHESRSFVVEAKKFESYGEIDIGKASKVNIGEMTFALSAVDPYCMPGMLQCHGYHASSDSSYFLMYDYPANAGMPMTLRHLLWKSEEHKGPLHPLNERLKLAKHLANAMLFVHAQKYVHKEVKPDNILLFGDLGSRQTGFPFHLGTPYLVGFGNSRKDADPSQMVGSILLKHNIYRHPIRQGRKYEKKYSKLDDLYALGVVLLEIALWCSTVTKEDSLNSTFTPEFQKCIPQEFPEKFKAVAKGSVPVVMGTKYYQIVKTCLSALDEDNIFSDPNIVGNTKEANIGFCTLFIEKVLIELESIAI